MKKNISLFAIVASIIITLIGCTKKHSMSPPPDVSSFSATAVGPYTIGMPGVILISSASMANGTYTLRYHYKYLDSSEIAGSTSFVMNDHSGSFQTPVLIEEPVTYVTIDSVANATGEGVALATNNFVALTDSTGLMTAVIGTIPFRTVSTYIAYGINILVEGDYYIPGSKDRKGVVATTTTYSGIGSYTLGDAIYISGVYSYSGTTNIYTYDTARYGILTINTTFPLLTGSVSFTCNDSTKVSASFTGTLP